MMKNIFGSVFSGFGHAIGNLFRSQLGFLSGKSCNSVCGPTWDLPCYIENFCIEHLLKLLAASFLLYIVLVLLYFLYKLRVFHCIFRSFCKMVGACVSTFLSVWVHGCQLLCHTLRTVKHQRQLRRRRRDIEMLDMSGSRSDQDTDMETSFSYHKEPYRNSASRRRMPSYRPRDSKRNHLRRSLRPRSHRVRLDVDGDSIYATKRKHIKHGDIRVIQTSSFARRGRNHKRSRLPHKRK